MNRLGAQEGLKIQIAENAESVGKQAARIIVAELKRKPDLLLCASAGSTPTPAYRELGAHRLRKPALFRRLRILQIDEWAGLLPKNPASCESDLRLKLLQPLGVGKDRYVGFKSNADNPRTECARVARWLAANGLIDVCILGLGVNGHVAMNEPAEVFVPGPHVAQLALSSQKHPLLKDLRRKPTQGLTLGLGDILRSRKILLLVSGQHKRAPLKQLLRPTVSTKFPASFLWLHSDATVICDREAASSF